MKIRFLENTKSFTFLEIHGKCICVDWFFIQLVLTCFSTFLNCCAVSTSRTWEDDYNVKAFHIYRFINFFCCGGSDRSSLFFCSEIFCYCTKLCIIDNSIFILLNLHYYPTYDVIVISILHLNSKRWQHISIFICSGNSLEAFSEIKSLVYFKEYKESIINNVIHWHFISYRGIFSEYLRNPHQICW